MGKPNEKVMDVMLQEFQLGAANKKGSTPTPSASNKNANRKKNDSFSTKDQTPVDSLQKYRTRPGAWRQKEMDKKRDKHMESAVVSSGKSRRNNDGMSQKGIEKNGEQEQKRLPENKRHGKWKDPVDKRNR